MKARFGIHQNIDKNILTVKRLTETVYRNEKGELVMKLEEQKKLRSG